MRAWFRTALAAVALTFAASLPAAPAMAAGMADPGLANLVATLLPSCVNITTTRYKEVQIVNGKSVIVQDAEPDKKRFYGSGFIITTDGYVVTNKHVTRNGISYLVTFADGSQYPAELIAQAYATDIAVLKIRSDRTWTPVKLGDSDELRRGDAVIAIGNPIGFQSTVTTGIISALNRDEGFTPFDDFIQTDAAINEGNSGGPLFNFNGEVIGVNTAIFTTVESSGNIGIGFAIPVNDAKFVVQKMREVILEKKHWRPAYLGASIQSLSPSLAEAYGQPGPWGSIVVAIDNGSPAAQIGLRVGDIITSLGGKDRKDSRALMRAIIEASAGATVPLVVWRDGKRDEVSVTLKELPPGWTLPEYLGGGSSAKPDIPPEALVNFGLQMAAMTPELRSQYKLDPKIQGVVVTGVGIGSQASDQGIDAGAVILRVRDTAVTSPEDVVRHITGEAQQKRPFVPMLITSDTNGGRWVAFRLE